MVGDGDQPFGGFRVLERRGMEEVVGVIREGEPFHGRTSVTISKMLHGRYEDQGLGEYGRISLSPWPI
jgi:hypothetical protein